MQLNEIRKELAFNTELVQLIETLKSIAASQYSLMEREKERFDRFMDAFSGFFRVVNLVSVENPFVRATTDVVGIIVITSDSGFMGGLNQGVIREALSVQGDLPNEKVALVVIGDKGALTFNDQHRTFKFFKGIPQDAIYEHALEISRYLVQEVTEGRMGKVVVAYPKPISFSAQTIQSINILPCASLFDVTAQSEVAERVKGRNFLIGEDEGRVVVESSFDDMVGYLAGTWVTSKLFEVFEDSKLAEFSARAMHLEGSLQTLTTELKKIRHKAFKASHEKIDKGMRESFAAGGKRRKKGRGGGDREE